jgi:hypothetical protein
MRFPSQACFRIASMVLLVSGSAIAHSQCNFYSNMWLNDSAVCINQEIEIFDSIQYYYPGTDSLYPYDFWNDPNRYSNNIEYFEADWDASDGLNDFEPGISLRHAYPPKDHSTRELTNPKHSKFRI